MAAWGCEKEDKYLLKSTLEIHRQVYTVILTSEEIHWELIGTGGVTGSSEQQSNHLDTDRSFRSSCLWKEYRKSDWAECVYYQSPQKNVIDNNPECNGRAILQLPIRHSTVSMACCKKKEQNVPWLCNICEMEKQTLFLKDIVAVHETSLDALDDSIPDSEGSFVIYTIRRFGKHKWRHYKVAFHHNDKSLIREWVTKINLILERPEFHRPRSLLVFINPISGKKNAPGTYEDSVGPLFDLAGITTDVIHTKHQNHARDLLLTYNLENIDGVVCVGGDGMFSEIVHGLLERTLRDNDIHRISVDTPLPQPKWRVGIIPAGSTDTVSYSTQGINDPVTSALHIIVGDDLAMDVGTIFHDTQFIKYNISFLGYGYYGDCIVDSESSRWMGPKRYDWAGFKTVLANRSYNGKISFLPSTDLDNHTRDGTTCRARCNVCQSLPSQSNGGDCSTNSESEKWKTVSGNFAAVNSFLISCRCRYALDGPCPATHLGDGCSDLVLVHKCSMIDYTQHLYRCSDASLDQFDFPFVETIRVTRFKFSPHSGDDTGDASTDQINGRSDLQTSFWNCDGEPIDQPTLEYRVHRQIIRLFARGIEDEVTEEYIASRCSCCASFRT